MTAMELEDNIAKKSPPNLRESSDYNKEPLAPRCFNCAYIQDENLDFYCSRFMVKTKVYQVCDVWRSRHEGSSLLIASTLLSKGEEAQTQEMVKREISENEPLILISSKKNSNSDPSS
jgi:hypothetical protein